ncbi:Dbl homology domain-containing protein [Hymenopellis radicata]|nr:Dbl homology domain-containing protein [Hymenopellis radicata]
MEVLSAYPASPSTPRPLYQSSIFHRRSKAGPETQRAYRRLSLSIRQEQDFDDVMDQGASTSPLGKEPSRRRSTTCGFLPLPSISASPICTPTTSMSSRHMYGDDFPGSSSGTDGYITAPPTPSDSGSSKSHLAPTWVSIPPTPPPKLFRRSVTCVARLPHSPAVSPSASFPASAFPHADPSIISQSAFKRRASAPSMSSYLPIRSASDSATAFVRRRKSKNNAEAIVAASPLRTSFRSRPPSAFYNRAHPMFSISHEVNSDHDDNGDGSGSMDGSAEASSSDQNHASELWHVEKSKDDIRKYHALMELLSTEVRYLMDLRVLVMIYLRQLPTITCRTPSGSTFGRTSSFTATSRTNSYTYLQASSNSSSTTIAEMHGLQPLSAITPEKKDKSSIRYLFTNAEIDQLTRNAEEVLQFHEHVVEEMSCVLTPLGFPMDFVGSSEPSAPSKAALANIEIALSFVATKFATEASRFNAYETFCAGHPEALDIVRRVQNQYVVEWDLYEQRCSSLISELLGPEMSLSNEGGENLARPPLLTPASESGTSTTSTHPKEKKRRSSVSSVEGVVWALRPKLVGGHSDFSVRDKRRLTFLDYLITPVQRICRYPMLLDQLKTGKVFQALSAPRPMGGHDVNVIVQSAAQAMKHVASRVDEARHRHDVALQSSLIVSRISRATPPLPQTGSSSRLTFQFLTPSFLSSLGVCLLAGSLDVMHHHWARPYSNAANINAKYLGAFLYLGGYIILVKVTKGKTYEPKHWFRLSEFELSDSGEDALLPCSFNLSSKGHHFELAAACQREKEAWISAIRESLSHTTTTWVNEPTSSLQSDGKGEPVPSNLDGPFETITSLPTIQSIPDISKNGALPEITDSFLAALATDPNPSKPKYELTTKQDMASRRSSSASMKAIFTPMTSSETDTVVIRRSSPSARMHVDQGLRDVISEPCVTARSHASSREEELFQAPSITRSGPPLRSQSTLSMSRLKKHESVRVLRRKSIIVDSQESFPRKKTAWRAKSLTVKKRPKKLSITSTNSDGDCILFLPTSDTSPIQSPATTVSFPPSTVNSPTRDSTLTPPRPTSDTYQAGERARSVSRPTTIVHNVGGFFRSRPSSPTRSTQSMHIRKHELSSKPSTSTFRRWMKPFHRRTHSAPHDAKPLDPSPVLPEICFGSNLVLTSSPTQLAPSPSSP